MVCALPSSRKTVPPVGCMGRYAVEWDAGGSREYRFFPSRGEAASFAAELESSTQIRHSNLEDVFVELTGRKAGL